MILFSTSCANQKELTKSQNNQWKLAIQAWSFKKFTFYEAVDKTAALGVKYLEAYPGQVISKEKPDIKFAPEMPVQVRAEIKKKLAQSGVTLINYGVFALPDNEAKCREAFEFAKDMGIKTIVSEPSEKNLDMIEKLAHQYKIKVAIHNHPNPSHYWNPDTVLQACKGRSEWIGACADTGHWMRSGLNPVDMLRKLQGRVISVHLKDLNEFGVKTAHDVPWGTGKGDTKAVLTELNRQNFTGVFSIEYEYNWEDSMPEISKCVEFFNKQSAELSTQD